MAGNGRQADRLRNQLAQRADNGLVEGTTIRSLLSKESVKRRFEEMLGKKAPGFMSSVLNVVNSNARLQECDPQKVLASAAIAASMDLPIDPNLGFAYIVPYKNKGRMEPQFQMGYKGYIQLAMRTGQYKTMNAAEVYEGELKSWNRITGEIEFDPDGKTDDVIIGYVAFFRLVNGFEKYLYMPIAEIEAHAARYSQSYKYDSSPWKTNKHEMCLKTVLKLLLSKYGILSIEMQTAVQADQAVVREAEDGYRYDYPDNPDQADGQTVEGEASEVDSDPTLEEPPQETDASDVFAQTFGKGEGVR